MTAEGPLWLVGGFLRDTLLNRPTADVDLAVSGNAKRLADRFAAAFGKRSFPLDEERGTYRVVVEREGRAVDFDFSKLQGETIEEDLSRRDFTINALALPLEAWPVGPRSGIIDPFGGKRDLAGRRVALTQGRVLAEDPLRLLRAFRIAAELNFAVAPATLKGIKAKRKLIRKSAPERVRDEIFKTLATPRAAEAFRALDRAGLLTLLFPEGEPMRRTGKTYYGPGGVLGHSIAAVGALEEMLGRLPDHFPKFHRPLAGHLHEPVSGHPRFVLLKLAELLHDVGKPATAKVEGGKLHFYGHDAVGARMSRAIASRLRLSSAEGRSLSRMVGAHMRPGNLGHQPVLTDRAVYRFFRDLEKDAVSMLIVSLADHFTYLSERVKRAKKDPVFLTIRKMLGTFFLKREVVHPPKVIDGTVLMKALHIKPGPEVGRLLDEIREAQATGKVTTRNEALTLAKKLVR